MHIAENSTSLDNSEHLKRHYENKSLMYLNKLFHKLILSVAPSRTHQHQSNPEAFPLSPFLILIDFLVLEARKEASQKRHGKAQPHWQITLGHRLQKE